MDNNYIIYDGQLYHHGVKGMKWGVRRYRRKARAAYSASSRMFGEKRRQKVMEKAREYDEAADALARGDRTKADALRKQTREKVKRAAKIGAAVTAGCLAAYGGYKLNDYLNSFSYTVNGKSVSRQEFASVVKTVAKSLS